MTGNPRCSSFTKWVEDSIERDRPFDPFPGIDDIYKALSTREISRFKNIERRQNALNEIEEPEEEPSQDGGAPPQMNAMEVPVQLERAPEFTHDEFARLCVLLRDDEQARAALNSAVGQELSRLHLDAGMTRDAF